MARTTLDIDDGVLRALKQRRDDERRPLGVIASELLARALADDGPPDEGFTWGSKPMGAGVDLEDKDALWAALDDR